MNNSQSPVFIIDGSSFLYRAYYGIRPLTTKEGVPVNAVYGFCRMIRKLIDTHNPSHLVLVWDSKGKTVRHELYPAYKENRQAAPNDLIQQKELIQEVAECIGIKQLAMPSIEADDLMYSVARQLEKQECQSVIVTSDKDLGQVLSARVTIFDPFKDALVTQQSLEEKLGFPLTKLPFYYALVGDSSDNIPGVAGIGPKGATKLVQQFESLKDMYNNLDTITSERTKRLLTESRENAFLSEQLFTLCYYDTSATKEIFEFKEDGWLNAYPLFQKFEFKTFLKGADLEVPVANLHEKYTFVLVDTLEKLDKVCSEITKKGVCALDTEGTSLSPLQGEMVGISVCVEEGTSYYIPFGHKTSERQLSRDQVFKVIKPIFEDPAIEKYLHHAKFDALMLASAGIDLKGITFDTIIAASLTVDDGQRIGLKNLSDYYLQELMLTFADVVKKKKYADFSYVPLGPATDYAAADAHQTMRLVSVFQKKLEDKGLVPLFSDLEMNVMRVLTRMERTGITLDTHVLHEINVVVSRELETLKVQIIDHIGPEFAGINLNSPKQLGALFFEHLGLPVIKKTAKKTGYSTDQEVLEQLSKVHPVPGLIMRYRELFKLKSTYLDALGDHLNPYTGAIHTTFNQTAVATGRLASSEPNLQNIPVDRFALRSAFKPRAGSVFLSADYSQIELRILAHVSQDATLLKAFKEQKDIHALTAAGLFSVSVDQVTSEQRQVGKRINFSILYGLTAHGLSKDLGVKHSVAQSYIDTFMAQYPGVVSWMEQIIDQTKEKGYVETVWGRRRYLPGIYERNKMLYNLARRVAINTVAQGTAADIMKWGMINLDKALSEKVPEAQILLQIHDELLLEVPSDKLAETEQLVVKVLEQVTSWNVPLIVTTRSGKDWQDVTK